MRLLKPVSLFLVIIVLFFYCKKVLDEKYPVISEVIQDIKVVTNPDYPRDGKVLDLLEEELSIGLVEGPEEYMLNRPFDVKVADDGTIFVFDWGDVCIKVYDKDGKYLRTVGQRGQGPGDFGSLIYMALSSDGKIFVMDSRLRRISEFKMTGEYLGGFPLEGFHMEMKTDDKDRIYYSKYLQTIGDEEIPVSEDYIEVESILQILRNDADGEDLYLLGDFEGEKDRMRRTESGGIASISSEFNIVWEISREALLYIGLNQEYKISVFDQVGKKLLTFGRNYVPVIKEIGREDNLRKITMPAYDPRIGWVFDDEGNLWVSIYSENEGEVVYDVFSPEGLYLRQVVLPCRICEIRKGKVYSIVTTEEGFMAVKRFSMKKLNNIPST